MKQPNSTLQKPGRAFDARVAVGLLLLGFASLLIHGYHLGHQDQAVWLPAIKKSLDPGLYPFDSAFFMAQTQYSLFPQMVAWSARATHLPVAWAVFLWHLLSIFLVFVACFEIAHRVFRTAAGRWGAVATVCAARLMVAAGTKVNLMDRYLHPRDLATAALLLGFVSVLDGRLFALVWIALAALMHPTMAVFGAFHLAVQAWKLPRQFAATAALAAAPVALWVFWPTPNPAWREAVNSRSFLLPLRWHWYEWLAVIVPLAMLLWYAQAGQRAGLPLLRHISRRLVLAGVLGTAGALIITTAPPLASFIPTEPMRVLHLVYLLWILLSGGLLGEFVLRDHPLRWAAFLVPMALAFCVGSALTYRASPLVEWPGRVASNEWVQAFDWARQNTPRKALFALNPYYMGLPGNDSHGFRAIAERGALADALKDRAVVANCPELAYEWRQEVRSLEGWENFRRADFQRLARQYGVSWVVLERSSRAGSSLQAAADAGLSCSFANRAALVCEIQPAAAEKPGQ